VTVIAACRTVPIAVVAVTVSKNVPGTMLWIVIFPDAGAGAVSVVVWLPASPAQSVCRRCSGDESFTVHLTSNLAPTLTGEDGPVTAIANAVGVGDGAGVAEAGG